MKKWIAIALAFFLSLSLFACAGSSDGGKKDGKDDKDNAFVKVGLTKREEKYIENLKELMVATEVSRYTGRFGEEVTVVISMPPYEEYFAELLPEAEKSASSSAKFGETILKMVTAKAEAEDSSRITYKKYLYPANIDPEKTEWTDEELTSLAITAVFDKILEDFCMNVIMSEAPALTTKEDVQ